MVRFETENHHAISYFTTDAERLLLAMGCSGKVPGALRAEDLPGALAALERTVARVEQASPPADPKPDDRDDQENDAEPPTPLRQRAFPLVELLKAAIEGEHMVTWQSS